ncbi:mCG123213, isoform CRA_b, partial [Mus musculus]
AHRKNPESQAAGALGDTRAEPSLEQVLQERDEAIAKKRAVEEELDSCRARLRTVEAQLLEVLQEKLKLKQEVEAWEEDMQHMVRERVRKPRGTLGTHENTSPGRSSWIQLSRGQWGRRW